MNSASLANDVGVDTKTIQNWLSILEASFIIFKLAPYFDNFGKRVIKSPKYYFTDTGLLCYLLGIETAEQVARDPLVGSMFENLVVLEVLKSHQNSARTPDLYFFRDSHGNEIDLLCHRQGELCGIEIKSSATYHPSMKKGLVKFDESVATLPSRFIVYSGEGHAFSDGIKALCFDQVGANIP